MTDYPTFPLLPGLGWSMHAKPKFGTQEISKVSGRSIRRSQYSSALYDIELTFEFLRADPAYGELQAIAGFFGEVLGNGLPFWLAPPGLPNVGGQALGTADGVTQSFPLVRGFAAYSEPAPGASGVSTVYENGVAVSSSLYALTPGYQPAILFTAAPASGLVISADYGLLWLCRFSDDVIDLENFMALLWTLQMVKLQTVRL